MISVLYIDDDEGLARLLSKALGRHGMTLTHAPGGEQGLAELESATFDIIALDHTLAGETGLDIIPRIRARHGSLPIIYVTGSDDARVAVSALKAGASDYVWKDVDGHYRELLAKSIEAALAQRRMQQDREEAQRAILEAKERAEALLKEVNHRVANSLAIVASFASLQSSLAKDPVVKDALNEVQGRILAIAGIHRRLYTTSDVRAVTLDSYLRSLCDELTTLADAGAAARAIEVSCEPDITVSTDRAISLAIIVTELVTNALKYAYPDGQEGAIRLSLRRADDAEAVINVADDGVGWTGKGKIQGTGLGSRIIQVMCRSARATLTYDEAARGTSASLRFAI